MFLYFEPIALQHGGYYSGFDTKPEIVMIKLQWQFRLHTQCEIKISTLSSMILFNGILTVL
jgi:hypothetical protein